MTSRIGFIGVGLMGHGMAGNLIEKGHALTVMGHRNRAPVDDLVKRGAKLAQSAAELARHCGIVSDPAGVPRSARRQLSTASARRAKRYRCQA